MKVIKYKYKVANVAKNYISHELTKNNIASIQRRLKTLPTGLVRESFHKFFGDFDGDLSLGLLDVRSGFAEVGVGLG